MLSAKGILFMPYSASHQLSHSLRLCVCTMFVGMMISTNSQAQTSNTNNNVDQQKAIATAKKSVKGKVLKVDRQQQHYRVKMLNPQGRVVSVKVDRQSGQVMPHKKSDKKTDKDKE